MKLNAVKWFSVEPLILILVALEFGKGFICVMLYNKRFIFSLFQWTNLDSCSVQQTAFPLYCETCYPQTVASPLSFQTFNADREWALHVPMPIQNLMECYLNPKTLAEITDNQESLSKKLQRLYFTHDILLNIFNKKHVGILQERNTFELIMGNRSVCTVFNITSSSGATMSLNIAEVSLKEQAEKDLCYFNTYLRHHPFKYKTAAGEIVKEVRMSDCAIKCLLLDNLVRLTYHADPKPGEHRSQQICTLPITIKGVPRDEIQLASWHNPECVDIDSNCACKQDIVFTSADALLSTDLKEEEKEMLQKYRLLCSWGVATMQK